MPCYLERICQTGVLSRKTGKNGLVALKDLGLLFFFYFCFKKCGLLYHNGLVFFDFIKALPLCLFVCYLYKFTQNPIIKKIYTNKVFYPVVLFVGGLSLEIYIVQQYLLTDSLNHLFPFNIVILYLFIIGGAYVVRCLARFIIQLFRDKPICFKEIVSLY